MVAQFSSEKLLVFSALGREFIFFVNIWLDEFAFVMIHNYSRIRPMSYMALYMPDH